MNEKNFMFGFSLGVLIGISLVFISTNFYTLQNKEQPVVSEIEYQQPSLDIPLVYKDRFTNKYHIHYYNPYGVRLNHETGILEGYAYFSIEDVIKGELKDVIQ
jgi:hypothetical protein